MPRDVHDLFYKRVHLVDTQLEIPLCLNYVEEIIVYRVYHLLLRVIVAPELDDHMFLEQALRFQAYLRRYLPGTVKRQRNAIGNAHPSQREIPS